jgi:o-succinylbenzoate synthase
VIRAERLIEHRFPLDPPLKSAAGTWRERHSLLLVLGDSSGGFGIGEAAPLPDFSRDTLEAARDALLALLGRPLPERIRDVTADLRELSANLTSPAARFALEAALLDAWSRRAEHPAWALLAPDAGAQSLPLSAWLPDGAEGAVEVAKAALGRGVTSFKVKLDAKRGLDDGVRTLEALRHTLGPSVSLRADANRSATRDALESYAERLRGLELEWLEEPTAEPLAEPFGVPIALDESIEPSGALPDFDKQSFVVALVLKPTALGGIARCLELATHARAHGRSVAASHTLEGPVGYMASSALAVALASHTAHGLAPHRALRELRPRALRARRDEIFAWREHGFGLDVEQALAGAEIVREYRA